MEDEAQGMARSALGLDQRLTNQVRVATGDGLASGFVIPRWREFSHSFVRQTYGSPCVGKGREYRRSKPNGDRKVVDRERGYFIGMDLEDGFQLLSTNVQHESVFGCRSMAVLAVLGNHVVDAADLSMY
jgi:hypothetical protein